MFYNWKMYIIMYVVCLVLIIICFINIYKSKFFALFVLGFYIGCFDALLCVCKFCRDFLKRFTSVLFVLVNFVHLFI